MENIKLIYIVLGSAAILTVAYFTYGPLLARLFQLNDKQITPAVEMRDNLDYEPLAPVSLLPQHFSAIAAAGPIVGPILAGILFGWLPALIWILVGSILIGGVHDFSSLVASIRHKAKTIAEVVRENMSPLSYLLFLTFIWLALVYIIVAFTDVTASAFVGKATAENGGVGGGAIASSSVMYLVITMLFGLVMRYTKMPLWASTAVFLLVVGGAIVGGKYVPLDVTERFVQVDPESDAAVELANVTSIADSYEREIKLASDSPTYPAGQLEKLKTDLVAAKAKQADAQKLVTRIQNSQGRKIWDVILLAYCLVAAVVPVWLLLQPRGHLGGFFLYFALGAGALGLIFGGNTAEYPAFRGFFAANAQGDLKPLFPLLFITIACGACSGFHSLISSGTTSKQLRRESDAKVIGYGTMLLEAMVAVVSLCCVMMFAAGSPELAKSPNEIYAHGIANFLKVVRIPEGIGMAFALMAFTTFVYDTLDVCTRLGRFIIQELTGWKGRGGAWLGTALTAGVPLYFLLGYPNDAAMPVWRIFWDLFGASNQLLAALTLLGVTVWIWRTRRAPWVWGVVGIPTVFMYVMSTWALWSMTAAGFKSGWPSDPVPYIGVALLALAALMLAEAIRILFTLRSPPTGLPEVAKSYAGGAS